MASANQLKSLLKSHAEGNEERFYSIAMQLAAHEAKIGHGKLAEELRDLVDQAKAQRGLPPKEGDKAIPIARPRGELAGLLNVSYPKTRLNEMVLDDQLEQQLLRVIREQRQATRLLAHGLSPRRKLLLVGPPGTGKTLTASVLAGELGLPQFQVRLDGLITKYMGETAAKLRQVFDATSRTRGVYFFDEFDAIGSQRGMENDVGEVRRILNSFLQMIEQDESHSLIVAATNHPEILDHALFRRFDDILHYDLPDQTSIGDLLKSRLGRRTRKGGSWNRLAGKAQGLSYAEITRACDEALKELVIEQKEQLVEADIRHAIEERVQAKARFTG
ncbi:MAG: ATP-binding protein [Gammaproteobacteria bacterium]|jgi:SpoVK/Ycf46/Vps4 family AAA+-type ATPase|nr:ATP-binding protein [Gammaproteobacteria bacterium]